MEVVIGIEQWKTVREIAPFFMDYVLYGAALKYLSRTCLTSLSYRTALRGEQLYCFSIPKGEADLEQ